MDHGLDEVEMWLNYDLYNGDSPQSRLFTPAMVQDESRPPILVFSPITHLIFKLAPLQIGFVDM